MAFTGGSAYTTATGGVCIWYPVLLGDLNLGSLFESLSGAPKVDKEHAYLIWVSDFSGVQLQPFTLPPSSPGRRFSFNWFPPEPPPSISATGPISVTGRNLTDRSTWGEPVATFVRKAGMFQSADGGMVGH